jgi:hypothetical protein
VKERKKVCVSGGGGGGSGGAAPRVRPLCGRHRFGPPPPLLLSGDVLISPDICFSFVLSFFSPLRGSFFFFLSFICSHEC